ncbi:MAG: hypothetical protein DYH02_00840 [Candidatus Omnitrophica bacterium COP1]|nr:hypothetical protein [Candidatus Omnitrophica bacterium COP1]
MFLVLPLSRPAAGSFALLFPRPGQHRNRGAEVTGYFSFVPISGLVARGVWFLPNPPPAPWKVR